MDPLSDVLRLARFTGAAFLEARFTAPWAVLTREAPGEDGDEPEAQHVVYYHLITQGTCVAVLRGEDPVLLEAGDLILFPRGEAHELASAPGLPAVPTDELLDQRSSSQVRRLEYGGGGAATRMVCGFLTYDPHVCAPLLGALPRVLRIRAGQGHAASWFESALRYTLDGSVGSQTGGGIVVARMAEVLFMEAVRRYVDTLPADQQGWLAGLRDPNIRRALALMHEQPAHPWTVDELGRRVAMSRSSLALRFAQVLGQPPMAYLASWRMRLAARMLTAGEQPIARIAEEIGYESESSFNRAFKRSFGVPPATFRREQRHSRMQRPARPVHATFDHPAMALGSAPSLAASLDRTIPRRVANVTSVEDAWA